MNYFAGLDVSLEETTICIVDEAGKIVREARVASEPEALVAFLLNTRVISPGSGIATATSLSATPQQGRLR